MRTLLLGGLATVLVIAGCGKGDPSKPMGAANNQQPASGSQSNSANPPGAGATSSDSIGEGGGGSGPARASGGNPTGSD